MGPHDRIGVLRIKGETGTLFSSPCDDTARRRPTASQEEGSHQTPNPAFTLTLEFQASRTVR